MKKRGYVIAALGALIIAAPSIASAQTVVIKRGSQGASHFDRDGRIDVAPLPVEEVDPTGAGDCFAGAYVSFRLAGASAETALRYANAAGAHAVTKLGPMQGATTREQLQALL